MKALKRLAAIPFLFIWAFLALFIVVVILVTWIPFGNRLIVWWIDNVTLAGLNWLCDIE